MTKDQSEMSSLMQDAHMEQDENHREMIQIYNLCQFISKAPMSHATVKQMLIVLANSMANSRRFAPSEVDAVDDLSIRF
jgi:hypothetical protein